MKKFTFLKTVFLTVGLLISIGLSAATETITITIASTGITSTSYDSGAERTWTQNGVSFGAKAVMKENVTTNPTIQSQANNGVIYNTTPLPGKLVSVSFATKTGQTARAASLYGGATERLVNSTTANYSVSGTQVGSSSTSGWTSELDGTEYTYFAIKRGANATYWTEVEIVYETATADPVITPSTNTIPLNTTVGVATTSENITVTTQNLTDPVTITGASAPFTLSENSLPVEGGSFTITYTPIAAGTNNVTLTLSSTGAVDKTITVTGTAGLAAPVAIAATDITHNSFTANWNAVTGAETYEVSVFVKATDTQITGSPFTATVTSQAVSALEGDTQYYYTVVAKSGAVTSAASDQIDVTTAMPVVPTIKVTEVSVPAFEAVLGTTDNNTLTVSGETLTADIALTLSGDNMAMFSVTPASIPNVDGTAAETTVTITYEPAAPGEHTALLTISSTGAESKLFNLTGTATLGIPNALPAEDVKPDSFTAKWETVAGADSYELEVYTQQSIFGEDFTALTGTGGNDGSWSGTVASARVSDQLPGWTFSTNTSGDVTAYVGDGCLKMGTGSLQGIATTPSLGLVGDATLTFRAGAWNGGSEKTTLYLELDGDGTLGESSVTMVKGEFTSYEVSITGATADTKVVFKAEAVSNSRYFLDDVKVVKVGTVTGSPFTVVALSKEIAGLTPATDYYYTVKAVSGVVKSEASNEIKVTTTANPTIIVKEALIPDFNAYVGFTHEIPITVSGTNLKADITFTISGDAEAMFSADPVSLPNVDGSVAETEVNIIFEPTAEGKFFATLTISSTDAESKEYTLEGNGSILKITELTVEEEAIPAFEAVVGETDETEIHVSGINLTGDITLTITGDDAAMYSIDTETITPVDGTVERTTVKITYTPTAAGTHEALLTVNTPGIRNAIWKPLTGTASPVVSVPEYLSGMNLHSNNGYLHFTTEAGQNVEIYNTTGVCLYRGTTIDGQNTIAVPAGVVMIRINNHVGKIVIE